MTLTAALPGASPVASVIISLALMLFFGFAMTRVTKRLRLPNVTAYILAGILLGPFCFDLVPPEIISGMDFLSDIALAFIAFGVGEFFKLSTLRKNGWRVLLVTLAEALLASVAVFVVMFFLLGLSLPFSIVLAALASATAPASTLMTIRQTGAKGDFVDTLLQVVALDDVVSLLAYSVAISVALASSGTGAAPDPAVVLLPIVKNVAAILLGFAFGFLLRFLITRKRSDDNRLIILVGVLLLFCGICAFLDVSPLLGCMLIGTVYSNLTENGKLFLQMNYFSPPILLLFFVRSGLSFRLDALTGGAGTIGAAPLWLVGVAYFVARIAGKYLGAWLGCLTAGKSAPVRRYLGLALVPQAGVAIGLAALGARTLGGETGVVLETVILASSVLYELIGPACAKLALFLAHAYSDKLEEVAPCPEQTASAPNEVEKLIARIGAIQKDLPPHADPLNDEAEEAFTEAAEEHYTAVYRPADTRHRPRRTL